MDFCPLRNAPSSYEWLRYRISWHGNSQIYIYTHPGISIYILFFFNKFIYFIYLYLAALGLHCCMWAFSSCGERGLLFFAVRGLLIAVASLVAEHRL